VVAVGGNQTNLFRLWLFDVAEGSKDPRLIATGEAQGGEIEPAVKVYVGLTTRAFTITWEGQKVSLEPLDLHEGRKCSVVPC
jgi:hypothetical protein